MIRLPSILIIALTCVAAQAESVVVRGRVIDEQGRRVANATVAPFWSANGRGLRPDGKPVDFGNPQDVRLFWSNEGQMAPRIETRAAADVAGRFRIEVPRAFHVLLVMDQKRHKGAVASIPTDPSKAEVEIRLTKLIRVSGRFTGGTTGKAPTWTHVYIKVPSDPSWPLSSCRIVSCGSYESRFEVLLPPGEYKLDAYGISSPTDDNIDLVLKQPRPITVTPDRDSVDLGVLPFTAAPPSPIASAKQAGRWNDMENLYGKKAPAWRISDARGIDKSTRLEDLRGKWVLLYFWNFGCRPCVADGIPKLMALYDRHASKKRQFEVIAFYVDWDAEIAKISDLEKQMQPYQKRVWGRRSLPFPILLDHSRTTFERYGVAGAGVAVLLDPTGKLVRGGMEALETILGRDVEQGDAPDRGLRR